LELSNFNGRFSVANGELLFSEIDGNAEKFYEFEKNISEVKLKDVKDLAKIKDYSFFVLEPEED